jgi:hypothetical protein
VRGVFLCCGLPLVSIGRLILAPGRMTMGIGEGGYVGVFAIFAVYRWSDVTNDRTSAVPVWHNDDGEVKVAPKIGFFRVDIVGACMEKKISFPPLDSFISVYCCVCRNRFFFILILSGGYKTIDMMRCTPRVHHT